MTEIRTTKLAGLNVLTRHPPFTTTAAICPHGMWAKANSLRPLLELDGHNMALYAPDLPGHGESPGDISQMMMEDYAAASIALAQKLREMGAEKVNIIGYSMGGVIAQMVESEVKPDAMVLAMSGAPGGMKGNFGWGLARCITWYLYQMSRGQPFKPRLKDVLRLMKTGSFDEATLQQMHEELVPESGRAAWQMFRGSMDIKPATCPTLVIAGKNDYFLPIPGQQGLAKFHNAEYEEVDAGHMLMVEPILPEVGRRIFDWLSEKTRISRSAHPRPAD